TLLVFVGGEFAFRRLDGPCDHDERNQVISAFEDASALYPDMLIMPGTIVSGTPNSGRRGAGEPRWKEVRNTAAAFWNGRLLHMVDKQSDAGTTAGVGGDDP